MTDTAFQKIDYTLKNLLALIEMGEIGLPDLQRPFVWKNAKVRDLFDSMYRGYPVGYFLFWATEVPGSRGIGIDSKSRPPNRLVVDGQQRLTSLYSVFKRRPVVRKDFSTEHIEIAFNPILEKFEVADAAIRRDRTFIADISTLWADSSSLFDVVQSYMDGLTREEELDVDERRAIQSRIQRLHAMENYPFTSLELLANVDEEQVAEVFVRINSKGEELKQADFILTLMSVFWDDGRKALEEFCRLSRQPTKSTASPFNYYLEPDPDQLLRVAVAVAFRRARLQHVYSILRGKDLDTGIVSPERREAQFARLKVAQDTVLNVQHWHDFLKAIQLAGYRGGRMITSNTNLIYTYVVYLIGRTELKVPERELRRVIARWFFMVQLTGRYTGSSEATFEFDLQPISRVESAEQFVEFLDRIVGDRLTSDFWSITYPNDLAKAATYSPSLYGYYAALAILDARALFSDHAVTDLLDPWNVAKRSSIERHHLFPRAYLKQLGITEARETDQIANYALTDWSDNQLIGGEAPADYLPALRARFDNATLRDMYYWHALPDGWEDMHYAHFLQQRRELMSKVVKDAFDRLTDVSSSGEGSASRLVSELIDLGEGSEVEFKSTLRTNLHTGQRDPRMEHAVLKTIVGFLNSPRGGRLVIGVSDDGSPVGLEHDGFPNEDRMALHLSQVIGGRIGERFGMYLHPHFESHQNVRVLVVDCEPARSPVFLKDGSSEWLYLRQGPSTVEIPPSQVPDFVRQRFSK